MIFSNCPYLREENHWLLPNLRETNAYFPLPTKGREHLQSFQTFKTLETDGVQFHYYYLVTIQSEWNMTALVNTKFLLAVLQHKTKKKTHNENDTSSTAIQRQTSSSIILWFDHAFNLLLILTLRESHLKEPKISIRRIWTQYLLAIRPEHTIFKCTEASSTCKPNRRFLLSLHLFLNYLKQK